MYKIRNKKFALLLTILFVLTIMMPLATPASAASTYGVSGVAPLTAATTFADSDPATTAPVTRITLTIPAGQLLADSSFRLSAPADFGFVPIVSRPDLDVSIVGVQNQIADVTPVVAVGSRVAATTNVPLNTILGAAPYQDGTGAVLVGPTLGSYNEWNITVVNGVLPQYEGRLFIDIYALAVPSGASEDVKLTVAAPPGSSLSSGEVLIGTIGTGKVELSISDVNTITDNANGVAVATLRIKEDRQGAFANGANSIKIKLPNGFTWATAAVAGPPALPAASASLVWGDGTVVPTPVDLVNTADGGRTLAITNPKAGGLTSTSPTYFTVSNLRIVVDESIAKTGDIVATVSGNSTLNVSELTVGKYADFSVAVEAGDPKNVTAGRTGQEIGKFTIKEGVRGSLVTNRTITLEIIGDAKWNKNVTGTALENMPRVDASVSNNNRLTGAWTEVGTDGKVIKMTVGADVGKATMVLHKGEIVVSPNAKGDIKVKVGGTAGASGEGVVAKVVTPITASLDGTAKTVAIGTQSQALAPIFITEGKKEALRAANSIRVEFPSGILPSLPSKVEVTEGDLSLSTSAITKTNVGGFWGINIPVRATSVVPSTVKISGITIVVDRTVPEGAITVDIGGAALITSDAAWNFPNDGTAAELVVATTGTPAPGDTKQSASFVIGSSTYIINNVEATMDVVPYVKDGRTYLPVRYVGYALGVAAENILWDGKTATLIKGDKVVQVTAGSKVMVVNGASINLDAAPELKDGRTMLPFRWIAWAFGASVNWDGASQTVTMEL